MPEHNSTTKLMPKKQDKVLSMFLASPATLGAKCYPSRASLIAPIADSLGRKRSPISQTARALDDSSDRAQQAGAMAKTTGALLTTSQLHSLDGVAAKADPATNGFCLQHTMLRIRDPQVCGRAGRQAG